MMRFDYLQLERPETVRRRPPENRTFGTGDLTARYRIAYDGREIIGASTQIGNWLWTYRGQRIHRRQQRPTVKITARRLV